MAQSAALSTGGQEVGDSVPAGTGKFFRGDLSNVILSLPLIQEGQLSECAQVLVNCQQD